VCAGCGKTAADAGVDKLRRCNGCPADASALWFCSVTCQKAVWVGGHKRECPRLDTAAQRSWVSGSSGGDSSSGI